MNSDNRRFYFCNNCGKYRCLLTLEPEDRASFKCGKNLNSKWKKKSKEWAFYLAAPDLFPKPTTLDDFGGE